MLRFLKTAAAMGIPFGCAMGGFFYLQSGQPHSLLMGAVAGLLFGLAMAGFTTWQTSRFTRESPCEEGEELLKQGPANQLRGWESVGGWLYLTDRRLVFRPHNFNVQKYELSLPLTKIEDAETCFTGGIFANGLRVLLRKGEHRFVVEGRVQWVDAILDALNRLA